MDRNKRDPRDAGKKADGQPDIMGKSLPAAQEIKNLQDRQAQQAEAAGFSKKLFVLFPTDCS